MAKDPEHFGIHPLATYISSFGNYLFRSFAHYYIWLLGHNVTFCSTLWIVDRTKRSFSVGLFHSVEFPLRLEVDLMLSLSSCFSCLCFMACYPGDWWLCKYFDKLYLCPPSSSFRASGLTIRFLLHFDLIFVHCAHEDLVLSTFGYTVFSALFDGDDTIFSILLTAL